MAYEKVGVAGKRFVASSLGAVEEVDEQRLRQWVPNLDRVGPVLASESCRVF